MRETNVLELRREMEGKYLKIHLNGEDVTETCTAFDTESGWAEVREQGSVVRKYGQVTVTKESA